MLVSLQWLSDYIDLKDLSPDAVAKALTDGGLEVESVTKEAALSREIVVGQILTAARHPNADTLQVCKVDIGEGEPLDIVCGAPNARAHIKVAVAKVGAELPGDFKIKKTKIRGEPSCGMLCSEKELGLSEAHAGIIELPEGATLGQPVGETLGLGDSVLELKVTPNRADCLGLLGVARDLSARLKRPLRLPAPQPPRALDLHTSPGLTVTISDEGCHRFYALRVDDVAPIPSPAWMQKRLTAAGMRPINLIVDATNYAMLEWSQPVHAYDARCLKGGLIDVRAARPGETLTTLDGTERRLEPGDLVIADAEGALGLAGIMGGLHSEVKEDTSSIVIEVASFDARRVRKTARRLALLTEASHRFERGTDRTALPLVALRVADLIVRGCDEARQKDPSIKSPRIAKDGLDLGDDRLASTRLIALRYSYTKELLGASGLTRESIREILESLGLRYVDGNEDRMVFDIPGFRLDIEREVDLIEEVARIWGYDRIPYQMPTMSIRPNGEDPFVEFGESVRLVMAEAGFRETVTFPFSSLGDYEALGVRETHPLWPRLRLQNPLSESHGSLQTTLIPGLLRAALGNRRRGERGVRLFECGRGYFAPPVPPSDSRMWSGIGRKERHLLGPALLESGRPTERQWLAGVIDQPWSAKRWDSPEVGATFYHAKATVEGLLKAFGAGAANYLRPDPAEVPFLHPGASALIEVQGQVIGYVGELHPKAGMALNLVDLGTEAPIIFECDLELLFAALGCGLAYSGELRRFPPISRDLAFLCDASRTYGDFAKAVESFKQRRYLDRFELFDVYSGAQLPPDKKSLAFTVHFQSPDKTLSDQDIESEMTGLLRWLETSVGATQR